MSKISPISGFPEFLPEEQIVMSRIMDLIRNTYESFGFIPLETPAVEKVEYLRAKGIEEKEVYALKRLNDTENTPPEFALRFDLTVPLARYVAQHYGQLAFPFRRYQMQPVWRGERPQAGRYRQFYQCDIDVIGDGELSYYYDAELVAVIDKIFTAMNIGPFTIRINHRKVLEGILTSIGLNEQQRGLALKIIDNMEKVSREDTEQAFRAIGLSVDAITEMNKFFSCERNVDQTLQLLDSLKVDEGFEKARAELKEVCSFIKSMGVDDAHYTVDLKIARGLDYYTGIVYETRLEKLPQIGSICSGGRYDNLVGGFINKKLPGVGISIGITRLVPQLIKEGILSLGGSTLAEVLVTCQNREYINEYVQVAQSIRKCGVNTELYLENKKLANQLKFADKKGFKFVVIADKTEFDGGYVIVKNMVSGEQSHVSLKDLSSFFS